MLDNFSLDIKKGEFVAVIGSSGSGKTTALKLINGLLHPDSGSVFVNGVDNSTVDQNILRRRIGYAIQGVGLFPHMTVEDNIAYVPKLLKMHKDEIAERINELLQIIRLPSDIVDRYPGELSGGQKQRVGIARALAAKPDILLMDEPFGAVDEITRKALQDEMIDIWKNTGVTVFFITHDINEALRLGSMVLVLDKGNIQQFDTPDNILNNPATEFVSQLIGDRESKS